MTFTLHIVAPSLRPYINFLYSARGAMPYSCDEIFPMPSTDLKFNFGDQWLVDERLDGSTQSASPESWCLGIWDRRHRVKWPATTDFLGVSFKPGGAFPFFGVPLSQLHNRMVPLDAIWGFAATEIRQRLQEAKSPADRFRMLESFLLETLANRREAEPVVHHVASRIMERRGHVRVGDLAAEVGVSHKHLITLFDRFVGCPPKELARLSRFYHTLQGINVAEPEQWTVVAQEFDYFDQSHFIRDFEGLAGLTPTEYLRRRREVFSQQPEHAAVSWMLPAG